MYKSILVAYNGTVESRSALDECIRLTPTKSAQIHLLAVVHPSDPFMDGEFGASGAYSNDEIMLTEKTKMELDLADGLKLLQQANLQVEAHLAVGEPAEIISNMARKLGSDLVIVGHARHKSWMRRWWRGSTDALLLEKVTCTLMIAPGTSHQV